MNNEEALALLQPVLTRYRALSYEELRTLVGAPPLHTEVQSAAGVSYQVEVQVYWDSDADGDIRVIANVDDGGWRAFMPLGNSFIKASDGAFADE